MPDNIIKQCSKCKVKNPKWIVKGLCPKCYANNYYWTKPGEKEKNRKRATAWANLHQEYLLNYYKELKRKVLSHYSDKLECACCGEKTYEFLTLDHINGGGRQHRKEIGTGRWFYTWVVTHKYPPLFQVLCMNCNFAKGVHGYCPHEKRK